MCRGAGMDAVVSVSDDSYMNIEEEEPKRGPEILLGLSAIQGVHMSVEGLCSTHAHYCTCLCRCHVS